MSLPCTLEQTALAKEMRELDEFMATKRAELLAKRRKERMRPSCLRTSKRDVT